MAEWLCNRVAKVALLLISAPRPGVIGDDRVMSPVELIVGASTQTCAIAAAVLACDRMIRRPSLYTQLVATTFLGTFILCQNELVAQLSGHVPDAAQVANPATVALSLATSGTLVAAGLTLAGGPRLTFSVRTCLRIGAALFLGTAALASDVRLLEVAQALDLNTSIAALLAFGCALLVAYRRQPSMAAAAAAVSAMLILANYAWYSAPVWIKPLTGALDVLLCWLACRADTSPEDTPQPPAMASIA